MYTFPKNGNNLFETNPNKPVSGLESVSVSVWLEISYLAKLIANIEFGMTQYA